MHRWPVCVSILVLSACAGCVHRSPGTLYESSTEELTAHQSQLREQIQRDVEGLSVGIGPRYAGQSLAKILAAEAWIVDRLKASGIESRRDEVDINGPKVANIEASFPGSDRPDEIIVIGAHYDTVMGSPGANDNASGVALLLATARQLRDTPTGRTVRIVFFVNEEYPFSFGLQMGSRVYAERSRARGDNIVAMICIDSIGYYSSEPGSQKLMGHPGRKPLYPPWQRRSFSASFRHRRRRDHQRKVPIFCARRARDRYQ